MTGRRRLFMILVKFSNNVTRKEEVMSAQTTINEAMENLDVDVRGLLTLNGAFISRDDYDKSFEELGVTDKARLYDVVKSDNA